MEQVGTGELHGVGHVDGSPSPAALGRAPAAVLVIDLDRFEHVNDEAGRRGGDSVLLEVETRLRMAAGSGAVVTRIGGDEYAVAMTAPHADSASSARLLATALLEALEPPFTVEGAQYGVGASIGIGLCRPDDRDAEAALRRASAAVRSAKHLGRGTVQLHEGPDGPRERASLTHRMRRALDRDEFVLHYQPVFDLLTHEIVGAEALVRWADPDRGLRLPGAFVPHAEETGLIGRLGELVIRQACSQAAEWRDEGLLERVGFNVAPSQLLNPGFVDRVATIVAAHGLDPGRLTIELTESASSACSRLIERALDELASAGFLLTIDDFGVGHSSLARLRTLPVHGVKLDRSFLADVPADPRATAVVRSLLALGDALGLQLIAEGIETDAQRRWLGEAGCRFGQGFHLGRPVPARELTNVLDAQRRGRVAA